MANNEMWKWLAIGAILFVVMGGTNLFKSAEDKPYNPPIAGEGQCALAPAYVFTGVDSLTPSTAVTVASGTNTSFIVNGVYVGSTHTPTKGEVVKVLANPANYISSVRDVTVGCSNNPVNFAFDPYTAATLTIKQGTSGSGLTLTDDVAGGAVNESVPTASLNVPVTFQSATLKSTGNMIYVIETATNSASNVSSIRLNNCGASPVAISNYVASSNANSFRAAFSIPAVKNGNKIVCDIEINPTSSNTIRGGVETTVYTAEQFIDVDGSVKEGIYDSNGVAKYQSTYDYDFMIA